VAGYFASPWQYAPAGTYPWGMSEADTFYSMTRIFEQKIGNRKEKIGKRKSVIYFLIHFKDTFEMTDRNDIAATRQSTL
jgi:hypothetical protein